jgi:LPXTG-motif cell wall-anchored protein
MRASLQQFGRAIRRSLVAVSAALLLALTPAIVHADNYGSGVYGNSVYNSGSSSSDSGSGSSSSGSSSSSSSSSGGTTPASSSSTNESTVVQTDSGLQVAINLSDGQVIPNTGYYITITPLNGQGKSFDRAEIYLDGKLAYSGTPDSTGTLKWLWDTATTSASKVKIIVYGPGDGTTTHEFSVSVQPAEAANNTSNTSNTTTTPSTNPDTTSNWFLWIALGVLGLIIILVIWLLIRRRRRNQQNQQLPPPPTFTPMQ